MSKKEDNLRERIDIWATEGGEDNMIKILFPYHHHAAIDGDERIQIMYEEADVIKLIRAAYNVGYKHGRFPIDAKNFSKELIAHGTNTFGSLTEFNAWLNSKTFLSSPKRVGEHDEQWIEDELTRIDYGIPN